MNVEIVPLAQSHCDALHRVLDLVAREKRYLAFTEAPPRAEAEGFYRNILDHGLIMSVLLVDGQPSGWCDVLPTHGQARAHLGVLGVVLLPHARHRGLGRPLMQHAIERAWASGLSRIELTVRADNLNAKALYERLGFVTEGRLRQSFKVDGEYHDACVMGLLRGVKT
jgi:putative acetyltransferase